MATGARVGAGALGSGILRAIKTKPAQVGAKTGTQEIIDSASKAYQRAMRPVPSAPSFSVARQPALSTRTSPARGVIPELPSPYAGRAMTDRVVREIPPSPELVSKIPHMPPPRIGREPLSQSSVPRLQAAGGQASGTTGRGATLFQPTQHAGPTAPSGLAPAPPPRLPPSEAWLQKPPAEQLYQSLPGENVIRGSRMAHRAKGLAKSAVPWAFAAGAGHLVYKAASGVQQTAEAVSYTHLTLPPTPNV